MRNAEGKKCRLGEGGFGVVYKAVMNGVDEVAVKLVKADTPSPQEMAAFRKEVRALAVQPAAFSHAGKGMLSCSRLSGYSNNINVSVARSGCCAPNWLKIAHRPKKAFAPAAASPMWRQPMHGQMSVAWLG